MGRPAVTLAALGCLVLTACARTVDGPTDQEPPRPGHVAPDGWHGIGFHGVSLDVPDTVTLSDGLTCGWLPTTGDLVLPVFRAGALSCPAAVATAPPAPRPDTVLTVVLTETGTPAQGMPAGSRERVLDAAGVTVTATGPSSTVDTVLASARVTPRDDHGCDARIDPAVAPRPLDPDGTDLLPVPTSAMVVCEYGRTGDASTSPCWLVASRELPGDVVDEVDGRLRTAPRTTSGSPVTPTPPGPVLRLLVRGDDGNTRVLQVLTNTFPQPTTDGNLTVDVGPTAGGDFSPLPTPFGGV